MKALKHEELCPEVLQRTLVRLALQKLPEMYDHNTKLFFYRVVKEGNKIKGEGQSLRYTIISLLGLHRVEKEGDSSKIKAASILNTLLLNDLKIDNIGDLGLILWLCALADSTLLDTVWTKFNILEALRRYPDARQGKTTELSWFLTGLTYASINFIKRPPGLDSLVHQTYLRILENQRGKGIFGHLRRSTIKGMIRGRIGCFADQVYPIYALSRFAETYGEKDALKFAVHCAESICSLQGKYGQWWWHYDSVTGKILGQYPVYSVHQYGMAPMALFALEEASGIDFKQAIYKGLEWVGGKNELGVNLIDEGRNVVWRSFYRDNYKMRAEEIFSILREEKNSRTYDDVKILYECRPYCLGWLLYALWGRGKGNLESV